MNTELFRKIRDVVDTDAFDMDTWEGDAEVFDMGASECGTTRCIAGWAIHFSLPEGDNNLRDESGVLSEAVVDLARSRGLQAADRYNFAAIGADLLGISRSLASEVFYLENDTAREFVDLAAAGDDEGAIRLIRGNPDNDEDYA